MSRSEPKPVRDASGTLGVGDVVEIDVTDLLPNGQGVGRAQGMVVFAAGPLPGERAKVRITLVKARYAVGDVLESLGESPDRVEPFCPVFGTCGGCQVQHLAYPAQLAWKREMVRNALLRLGGIADPAVAPTVGMTHPRAYRNKAALVVDDGAGTPSFGFYEARSHDMVAIKSCPVTVPFLDRTIANLWEAAADRSAAPAFRGARHVVVRVSSTPEQGVASITTDRKSSDAARAAPALQRMLPGIVGIANSYDPAGANAVMGRRHVMVAGQPQIEEEIGGVRFAVSASSFFQINRFMVERIFEHVRPMIRSGARIVDLYCGAGTFALLFASAGAHVVGLEENRGAVQEARANAERNGLADRASFQAGRVERLAQGGATADAVAEADVVFLDPPRKGSDEPALAALAAARVPQIWYLSCNPATLARDVAILTRSGYALGEVQPFDMFPQTGHVEAFAVLRRLDDPARAGAL